MLGDDWARTYAVSNSLYVTRQNNILFTVLAQFMGREAIGDRLLLIETPEFTTTPETLLEVLPGSSPTAASARSSSRITT